MRQNCANDQNGAPLVAEVSFHSSCNGSGHATQRWKARSSSSFNAIKDHATKNTAVEVNHGRCYCAGQAYHPERLFMLLLVIPSWRLSQFFVQHFECRKLSSGTRCCRWHAGFWITSIQTLIPHNQFNATILNCIRIEHQENPNTIYEWCNGLDVQVPMFNFLYVLRRFCISSHGPITLASHTASRSTAHGEEADGTA